MSSPRTPTSSLGETLTIAELWAWLQLHYNCILRVGGSGFALFDQDDVHWHLGADPDGTHFVQIVRGKEILAEVFFNPADVHYVQTSPGEEEQVLFECFGGDEGQSAPLCHFLMTHGYDAGELPTSRTWTH
jgi:hypothetical protein